MLFLYSSGSENGIPETLNPDLDELENTGQGQILKGFGTVSTCVPNICPTQKHNVIKNLYKMLLQKPCSSYQKLFGRDTRSESRSF